MDLGRKGWSLRERETTEGSLTGSSREGSPSPPSVSPEFDTSHTLLARAAGNLCLGICASTGGGANSLAKVYAGLIKGALPCGPINQTVTEKITTVCDGAKKNLSPATG
jgi:hypothetical protein